MNRYRFIMLLAFSVAIMPDVHAEKDGSDSLRSYAITEVSVTAKGIDRNVGATRGVQQLSKQDLLNLGIDNVADAVKRFAGVSVKDYGGIGGMKTVSIHNLGAHHTAVCYDGITVSNTQAGQIDIGRYNTENLQMVALSVGGEDDLMQSARQYAAAGVISMVTERPQFEIGRCYALKAGVQVGSFGLVTPSLRWWQKMGDRTSLSLSGKMMRADGVYPYTLHNGKMKTREHRYNSAINAWQGEADVYHQFKDSSELNMKAYWYYSKRELPGVVILYANPSDEKMWDEDFFVQALYSKCFSKHLEMKLRMKFTHSWNQYKDWGSQYPGGVQTDIDRQNEYYVGGTLGWHIVKGLDLAFAQDVSFNELKNNVYVNVSYDVPNPQRWTSTTALALKWRWNRLKVDGNVAYLCAMEHMRNANVEKPDDKKKFTPSLSFNYRLFENYALYVRAMVKNTFRIPTFNDLYYRRLGNINLRPELAHEYSAGLTWEMHAGKMKYFTFTADGYYNNVIDKIVAFPSAYVWRMLNYGKAEIVGMDVTFGTQIDLCDGFDVKASAAATWQRAVDKTNKDSQIYNNLLPYTPRVSGNGSLILTMPWLSVGYSVLMQGRRYSAEQNTIEYRMPAFWEHSLSVQRAFKVGKCQLDVQAKCTNLLDAQYEIIQYYPMPGRQFSVSVVVKY